MESKASTLLMTHKKVPLMVTLFETLDGFILDTVIFQIPSNRSSS